MPGRVYSFDLPDSFVCGTLGQPGQRTFYLQAVKAGRKVTVALEKAQVALLAERLAALLLALRQGGIDIGDEFAARTPELAQPVIEEFRVGTLTLGWDGDIERIVIEAREMGDADDEADEDDEAADADEGSAVLETAVHDHDHDHDHDELDVVRVQLEPSAALEFATSAVAVVQAGRPPCPQCGAPLEPTGHFCPRRNGYAN